LKIMTVELAKPFQWPEVPADKEPWSNRLWSMREELMTKRNDEHIQRQRYEIPLKSKQEPTKERQQLADLAKQMLSGEVKWSNDVNLDPKWDSVVEEQRKAQEAKQVAKPVV
jgi:large subunit ribosomal protein L23